jgi:hypothetical protein
MTVGASGLVAKVQAPFKSRRATIMVASGRFGGLSKRSVFLMIAALAIGFVHHIDHVLRFDHSGWPFRPTVNPFTFSLLAYPIALFALFGPARFFWVRWFILLLGMGSTLWAHTAIETPGMQFARWAHNHTLEANQPGAHNLLGIQSGAFGILSLGVSMALNLLLLAGVLSMFWGGVRRSKAQPALNRWSL